MSNALGAAGELAIRSLVERAPLASSLAQAFKAQGFTLALVGGPVRDAILGRLGNDLDFTTNAHPLETKKILQSWADNVWDTGIAFGTVAGKRGDTTVEVTTYRTEQYDPESRKPEVEYGDSIHGDLSRRDFTVNSMALELTGEKPEFIDPFNGLQDLAARILRTPVRAGDSFNDDPLRMMRAARFASQLDFQIAPEVLSSMTDLAHRISIISAERVRDEFIKIIMSPNPRIGITLLVDTGLADIVLPEIPKLRLEVDEHHHHKDVYEHSITVLEQAIEHEDRLGGPNLVIRLAALLHDIGKMGIPDSILLKKGHLTEEERKEIQKHPVYAYEMLKDIVFLKPALDIPYSHHEKWDGSGYPDGLAGEDIPLHARIFAFADVYDALTSARSYRPAWTEQDAIAYIREQSGRHFDPSIVPVFIDMVS